MLDESQNVLKCTVHPLFVSSLIKKREKSLGQYILLDSVIHPLENKPLQC